jgi:hypothetical protein
MHHGTYMLNVTCDVDGKTVYHQQGAEVAGAMSTINVTLPKPSRSV